MSGNNLRENEIRAWMCEIGKCVWQKGWGAANDGNLTVKLGENRFLATPSGVSKGFMKPEMMTVVDAEGTVLEGAAGCRVTSELKVHLSCYRLRPDIGAVIHAHPPIATAYAVAGIPLDGRYMPETAYALGAVPIAEYAAPGSDKLAQSVEPFLQEHDALLLANHGAVSVGKDLTGAYYTMETLEFLAQLTLHTTLIGKANRLSEKEMLGILESRRKNGASGRHPGMKVY